MPCLSVSARRASITWARLPSSFLIVSVLRTSARQDAVFRALLVDEVMAEDLVAGLELAVDAAVALLHAAGVPGTSKWNRFQQWA